MNPYNFKEKKVPWRKLKKSFGEAWKWWETWGIRVWFTLFLYSLGMWWRGSVGEVGSAWIPFPLPFWRKLPLPSNELQLQGMKRSKHWPTSLENIMQSKWFGKCLVYLSSSSLGVRFILLPFSSLWKISQRDPRLSSEDWGLLYKKEKGN